jgi:short-subunit dehydrogenase
MSIPIPDEHGTCLITGASSGIGESFARQIAERGYNVTLAARRIDRLTELAAEIERDFNVKAVPVQCDITDDAQVDELLAGIEARGDRVDILVNNAGRGEGGNFVASKRERELAQIDLNVRALVALTHRVLGGMVDRGTGAIVNVASTAAFQPMPRQNVYAATKSFVLFFSEGLSQELRGTGVSVTVLCPGPTKTEFFPDMEKMSADTPGVFWQTAEEVAKAGIDGLFKRKRVVVPKWINRIGAVSGQHSPRFATLQVIDRFWPVGKH